VVKLILINDLARHSQAQGAMMRETVERVLATGWFILGPECSNFEREFADYCGVRSCVGVANGTDALELSFGALGLGPGKRVATVANAGCYASTALRAVGAEPVYIDVGPDYLMDLDYLNRALTEGLDAVVVTHLFGLMHDMVAIRSMANRVGVPVIEDCAQAHGAERDGRRAGSVGDVGTFSFYPTKNLGAIGDGGAIVTNGEHLEAQLRRLRQYGWQAKYQVAQPGGRNSRLDEIQAAVLRAKLPYLDSWNNRRREIAARYSHKIDQTRFGVPSKYGPEYVAHLYVITSGHRDALRNRLTAAGISSDIHYPVPDHRQLPEDAESISLPRTERLARTVLTLPCFPELTDNEVDYVIEVVNSW
jgi:dTDP-3-amino-2,3,6-trideoxy-4-keto-D-glucose/dTDP-3-amino-3,4,6-trideoxy-alpha-D-glucose/dTDP-2,6-dideoxy-D-kanosamine transaminase